MARAILRAKQELGSTRSVQWSDVMLLVKKRAYLTAYESALRGAGIPFVSDKRGGLLGSLEVADFGCDLVERRRDRSERCQVVGMAVALNYLGRHSGSLQSQPGADLLFEFRREMGKRSHRARELAYTQIFGGGLEARDQIVELVGAIGRSPAPVRIRRVGLT